MLKQVVLDLKIQDDFTFNNFIVHEGNHFLIEQLKSTARGQGELFIYLWSQVASGRSHLLQAACHIASQCHLRAAYFPLKELQQFGPSILEGLENLQLLCLDDLQCVVNDAQWCEKLFYLFNSLREAEHRFIIAANALPQRLSVSLPDLASRLSWGIVYQLHELTDEEKLKALQLRAHWRGMQLSDETGEFLLARWPRDLTSLLSALEILDHASLQAQRRLTIPFVKQVLKI